MPGPDVAVNARAPFQEAPMTMPIEASSSSAWTMANLFCFLAGSTRTRCEEGGGFGKGGRRRDRIPGAQGGAAIDRAERGRRIAFDENPVADRVRPLQAQPDRVLHIHHHPVAAEMERVLVGVE